MSVFPPKHVCIAGALLIALGVWIVADMLASAMFPEHFFAFNIGFLCIPLGYGLLIGSAFSRRWVTFFSGFGLLSLTVFGCWDACGYFTGTRHDWYSDGVYDDLTLLVSAIACAYIFVVLRRQAHREWFEFLKDKETQDDAPLVALFWSIVIVSALSSSFYYAARWRVDDASRQLRLFRACVTPYNVQTGEGVDDLTYRLGKVADDEIAEKVLSLPEMKVSFMRSPDGMQQIEFFGVSTHPVKITVLVDGFEEVPIVIGESPDESIRLAMTPLNADLSEGREGRESARRRAEEK